MPRYCAIFFEGRANFQIFTNIIGCWVRELSRTVLVLELQGSEERFADRLESTKYFGTNDKEMLVEDYPERMVEDTRILSASRAIIVVIRNGNELVGTWE